MPTPKQDIETVLSKAKLDDLMNDLGLKHPISRDFIAYALANVLLFERKHNDYGPDNIKEFMAVGCLVRMSDKFSRLKHLYNNRRKRATNESITDSWRDLSNYCIIAMLCEDSLWR